ncbi:glutamine synthetase [Ruminococcaceae bacterium YRB3002]|nr:glutamine synthetase [Ruminococcaceae bacterium YRB3002]
MSSFTVNPDLIYFIPPEKHSVEDITRILDEHKEIRFVSLVAVDLAGNDTDEKIPIADFHDHLTNYLNGQAVQTDGSSVVLPGIATLNDGKVDLIPDPNVVWYIDYNYSHTDTATGLPVGTLRIPSFLEHNGKSVCSRSVLKKSAEFFEDKIMDILNKHPEICSEFGFDISELDRINLIMATELEFWVNSPDEKISTEQLTISQELQEQYWKRTKGVVRTALEQVILLLGLYGFNPEMGHKEVGGVKAAISSTGDYHFIMEQLEVDWKYSDALQGADYELCARIFIKELFRLHGLDVSFDAKPLNGVAGSGEHTHVNAVAFLKNGKKINLFAPSDMKSDYLSRIGWGSLFGIMKHYDLINPFVSSSTDAFNRLQPGFEAPTHCVASLGMNVLTPSRNRSVLLGVVRSEENKAVTRFELRSPNPHTNTYLCLASIYQCMLDGITYVVDSGRDTNSLETEFTKPYGEEGTYLDTDRLYRCEEDIFESMTGEERDRLFGKPSATVYDSMNILAEHKNVTSILCAGDVFDRTILDSYARAMLERWEMELRERIIPENRSVIRSIVKKHSDDSEYDNRKWSEIVMLRDCIAKDSDASTSLFSKIKAAIAGKDLKKVSALQIEMNTKMNNLRTMYRDYCDNQI